mmetsp:Transcript_205/g.460  ORF Transcript_205/g.460 Transcript_205/m.460 type:complete len:1254 (+) Transcript_205:3-3764(+)
MPPPQPPMPPHPNMGQYVLNTPMQGPTPGTNFAGSQGTFSAQRPLLFNSERGFSSTQSQGAKPPRKDLPKGKYMSPSDVRYIVNKVLQPMESTDPFAEDFYFLQLSIKKNSIAREAALAQQSPMPSSIYVPLPVWKETKERLRLQMDVTRKSFHDRSRQWESRERVLGHQVRTDIWRPREQLAMPRDEEPEIEEGTEGAVEGVGVGEEKAPFSSRLWTMRSAVQRGYEALYTVQELQHLLSSPLVASNPTAYQEIAREIDSAIALLSQSIGIRTTNGMGVGGAGMGMGAGAGEASGFFPPDDRRESRMARKMASSKAKGKRLSIMGVGRGRGTMTGHNVSTIAESPSKSVADAVFSPAAVSKAKNDSKGRSSRRDSTFFRNGHVPAETSVDSHHSGVDCGELSFGANNSSMVDNSTSELHVQRSSSALNEINFRGVVVGGLYQHCFDNACPLVAAPSATDKRVTAVTFSDNALTLSLYLPRDKRTKQSSTTQVDLGPSWHWIRCSPIGYLVFRDELKPDDIKVCYFLPKHPDDWSVAHALNVKPSVAAHEQTRTRQSAALRLHIDTPPGPGGLGMGMGGMGGMGMEMDCHPLHDVADFGPIAVDEDCDNALANLKMHTGSYDGDEDPDPDLSMDITTEVSPFDRVDKDIIDAESSHLNNVNLVALVLDFLVDDAHLYVRKSVSGVLTRRNRGHEEEGDTYQCVSKTFCLGAYMVIARRKSVHALDSSDSLGIGFDNHRFFQFVDRFSFGQHLSQGACKEVYKIAEADNATPYALSVMDIIDLGSKGMSTSVVQEVEISLLCSSLLTLNICPNLVEVHSLFQSELGAPVTVWDGKGKKFNLRKLIGGHKRGNERFQYIRMEFCAGGDLECVVRQLGVPDLSLVQSYLFQMCFSMYTCREKLSMRHFDVKLLNFFTSTADCLLRTANQQRQRGQQVDLHVGLGEHIYRLPLSRDGFSVVKLADFGTSVVGSAGLGEPITQQQFTTLENTPPEFLLLGSWARQGCSADTFPLGLCFFHLLTGYEPYEELLKDVRCPPYLCEKLAHFWRTTEESSPYFVVSEVIESLDRDSLDGTDPGSVLYDTLYRYLVLFGGGADFQSDNAFEEAFSVYADSPVWAVVCEALGLRKLDLQDGMGGMATRGRRGGRDGHPETANQYAHDLGEWSMHLGSHPIMRSCRERLARLGAAGRGSSSVLDGMLHFDPARRSTMFDLLQHPMFANLRMHPQTQAQVLDPSAVSYLHYFRPTSHGCVNALPIL